LGGGGQESKPDTYPSREFLEKSKLKKEGIIPSINEEY
jgi:hypothetical protein